MYYDQEAAARANRAIDPQRMARRDAFVTRMRDEGASTVVEIGTGPGRDGAAFLGAGIGVVGIDLSAAHARLALGQGVTAMKASVYALPFRDGVFAAGWTMSTLVHVPNDAFGAALTQICRVIRPGGLLAIGLWGAPTDLEEIAEWDTILPKRFFSRRTDDRVRAMLEPYGRILEFDTWARELRSTWTYQFLILRTTV